jgi:hypothetical protein
VSTFLQLEAAFGPALIAWLMIRRFVPDRSFGSTIELMGAAAAIGLGLTSSLFFVWRLIGMQPRTYVVFDLCVQALLFFAIVHWRRRRDGTDSGVAAEPPRSRVLGSAIAAAALLLGAMLLAHTLTELPYGWSDGWSIWNLRAAFLSAPGDQWSNGFSATLGWSHPDYPLLVPASVARLWSIGESTSAFGPQLVAVLVVTSSALALAGSVARHAGPVAMSLALSLLLVPSYVYWGGSQTADVPLGLYMLIAVAALSAPPTGSRYVIAGLAAGLATWTKNEGVLAAAAIVLVVAVMTLRSGRDTRLAGRFAVGLAAGVIALVLLKLTFAPPSDLMRQIVAQQPWDKAIAASRHVTVARYLLQESFAWGNWFLVPPSVLLVACVVMAGVRRHTVPYQVAIGGGIVALMIGGYYWTYVLSPYDLQWHMSTSWPRLVAQIWPVAVWTAIVGAFSSDRAAPDSPK